MTGAEDEWRTAKMRNSSPGDAAGVLPFGSSSTRSFEATHRYSPAENRLLIQPFRQQKVAPRGL